jgi:energy-converting hydrogenase Eha subunit A
MALDAKTKAHVEHYLYAVIVAGVAIYQTGNHDIKKVAVAAIVGVLGPVVKAVVDKIKTSAAK